MVANVALKAQIQAYRNVRDGKNLDKIHEITLINRQDP